MGTKGEDVLDLYTLCWDELFDAAAGCTSLLCSMLMQHLVPVL